MPTDPGLFIDIMHPLVVDVQPFSLGLALYPVPVVALCLQLSGNVPCPIAVPFKEKVLGLPDGNKISHFPMAPVV